MKIKSFKGRRLVAELTPEEVAEKLKVTEAIVMKIEAMESTIKAYDELLDAQHEN